MGGPGTGPTPGPLTIRLVRSLPVTPNPTPASVIGMCEYGPGSGRDLLPHAGSAWGGAPG